MPDVKKQIARASDALKKGRIDEADRLIAKILSNNPQNPSAHNLRALALIQRQDTRQALAPAQHAVDLAPENFRYRGNLGTLLLIIGRDDAALPHLDHAIALAPDYHLARRSRGMLHAGHGRFEAAVADLTIAAKHEPDRIETRIVLANALIETKKFEAAAEELRAAEKNGGQQDSHWKYVWGRLMYRLGRIPDARLAFTAALLANPDKIDHFIALSAASYHGGDLRQAQKIQQAGFRKFPTAERASGVPELRVLVLETLDQDYFSTLPRHGFSYALGNFIARMPAGRIAYTHVITDFIDSFAETLDLGQFDVAYNNCVEHDTIAMRSLQQRLGRIVADLPMPLINRPEAVAQTTRDGNADRFSRSERFLFPRTIRVEHGLDPSTTREQILNRLKLPLILRPLGSHVGAGATLVQDERELDEAIAELPYSNFYAIEYHDCQSDDGLFRRYRITCIDGHLFTNNLHVASQWNVHGAERETLGWFERGLDREEMAFHSEPGKLLNGEPADIFADIVQTTPLDIYGFDFGIRRDGKIVLFEVNASMACGLDFDFTKYSYRKPYADKFVRDTEALFFARSRRSAAPATGPVST